MQFDNSQLIPAFTQSGLGDLIVLNFHARDATCVGDLEIDNHELVGKDYFAVDHNLTHGQGYVYAQRLCSITYLPLVTYQQLRQY